MNIKNNWIDDFEFDVPAIKSKDWNLISVVRPCLEMLVLIEYQDLPMLAYIDVDDNSTFWVTTKGLKLPYKEIKKWMPIDNYMSCVAYGERLKFLHEKNNS